VVAGWTRTNGPSGDDIAVARVDSGDTVKGCETVRRPK
jgi:hypothetical protein